MLKRDVFFDYEVVVKNLVCGLSASLPDDVRGFGHVKLVAVQGYRAKQAGLLAQW